MEPVLRPNDVCRAAMALLLSAACLFSAGCIQLPKVELPELPTPANRAKKLKQNTALARLAERRGQTDEALHAYNKILEKYPNNQVAHHRLGVVKAQEGKFAEADQHFHRAWQIGPQSADLLCDMGFRLYLEHRLPEAEKLYREALQKQPKHPSALNNLGLVLGEQGRYHEALACFREANPDAQAEANLAFCMMQRGDIGAAQVHFNQALTLDNSMRPAAQALLQIARLQGANIPPPPERRFHAVPPANVPPGAQVPMTAGIVPPGQSGATTAPVATTQGQPAYAPTTTNAPIPGQMMAGPQAPAVQQMLGNAPRGDATVVNYSAPLPPPQANYQPNMNTARITGVSPY